MNITGLKEIAKDIRRKIVEMTYHAGSGHPGGSLSATDFMTALYFEKLNHDPKNPTMENRDRVVLSKGHAAPVLYACLAKAGYFPEEDLKGLRQIHSHLQGHPSVKTPGVEVGTGSLGLGFSVAAGIALSAKMDKKEFKTYAILGDGEMQEGSIWETLMFAGHHKLNNLCAFIDHNNLQIDGNVSDINGLEPLGDKLRAFNWKVISIDGHSIEETLKAIDEFKAETDKPVAILAKTVKGKGVSFMENVAGWHGKACNDDELAKALEELK